MPYNRLEATDGRGGGQSKRPTGKEQKVSDLELKKLAIRAALRGGPTLKRIVKEEIKKREG